MFLSLNEWPLVETNAELFLAWTVTLIPESLEMTSGCIPRPRGVIGVTTNIDELGMIMGFFMSSEQVAELAGAVTSSLLV